MLAFYIAMRVLLSLRSTELHPRSACQPYGHRGVVTAPTLVVGTLLECWPTVRRLTRPQLVLRSIIVLAACFRQRLSLCRCRAPFVGGWRRRHVHTRIDPRSGAVFARRTVQRLAVRP